MEDFCGKGRGAGNGLPQPHPRITILQLNTWARYGYPRRNKHLQPGWAFSMYSIVQLGYRRYCCRYFTGIFRDTMKKVIHINQHVIRKNTKTGERKPVITCKTYKGNTYCQELIINDHTKVIYRPDKPLPCGAKVWIETTEEVKYL